MLSLALLLLAAQPADDKEWFYIDTSDSGTAMYARVADLSAGNSQSRAARLWIKFDTRKNKQLGVSEMKTMYVVDCLTESYRTITTQLYYSNGTTETVKTDTTKVEFVIPESRMAAAIGVLCWDGPES